MVVSEIGRRCGCGNSPVINYITDDFWVSIAGDMCEACWHDWFKEEILEEFRKREYPLCDPKP